MCSNTLQIPFLFERVRTVHNARIGNSYKLWEIFVKNATFTVRNNLYGWWKIPYKKRV